MSDENLQVAGEVQADLSRLSNLMNRFASDIAAVAAVQKSQQEKLRALSRTFTQELSEARRGISSELGTVCEQCRTLQQRTLQSLHGIRFISAADEGFRAISGLLEAMVRDTETGLTTDLVSEEARGLLDGFREKYTMEIEHLLHDGVVAGSGLAAASCKDAGGSELGQNIELF